MEEAAKIPYKVGDVIPASATKIKPSAKQQMLKNIRAAGSKYGKIAMSPSTNMPQFSVSENVKRIQSMGRVYVVMVNFYGKYYTIKLYFSGSEQPSREEVATAVEKIYPSGKVLAYYPAMNTVGSDNYIIAKEEAEPQPEPKYGNTTYDSAEKRRRNYLMNIGVIGEGAAWTRKEGQNKKGGLNEKGRKSYERENPGSDLKAPSKKVGNKRRASFCARMSGMKKKLISKKTANDPNSRINKSLRAWNC